MVDIKTIRKDTDFNTLKMSKLDWDVMCHNLLYDVYKVDEYFHSIGGKYGTNDYWACPRGAIPTYENLVQFNGAPCSWDISLYQTNYIKSKWDDTEIRTTFKVVISRNNSEFYSFSVNDLGYGLAKAQKLLAEIHEHPIMFNAQNYEKDIIGRKIYWREQPAIITSYTQGGNLSIAPDGIKGFKRPAYEDNTDVYMSVIDDDLMSDGGIIEDLFASSIYWFREKDYYL